MRERKITRIVWHTAAHAVDGIAQDTTAKQIDAWHRAKGWTEIGYNVVVRFDGTIEPGRDPRKVPAGVAGMNSYTYHICFSGHGDLKPLTDRQLEMGIRHTIEILKRYNLTESFLKNPMIVMGHREVNLLVEAGLLNPKYRTTKTCPGKKVDMSDIRKRILERIKTH